MLMGAFLSAVGIRGKDAKRGGFYFMGYKGGIRKGNAA